MPASAQSLLELRLGEWGHDAMGFVAHIPHYVAQFPYPQAALALLEGVRGRHRAAVGDRAAAAGRRGPPGRARHPDRRLRRGPRGRHRPGAAVRRVPHRLGQPAGRGPAPAQRRGARGAVRAVPGPPRGPGGLAVPRSVEELRRAPGARGHRGQPVPRASSRAPACSASSAARSPRRRWPPPRAPCPSSTSCTACTPTSCGPGDTSVPIVYDVDTLREGRSFATRRILARQHGRPIFAMTANYQIPEDGLEHQDPVPDVPRARGLPDPAGGDARLRAHRRPLEAGVGRRWRSATRATPAAVGRSTPATSPPARGCGSAPTASCPTTRSPRWSRSPTPAT